MSTSKYGLKNDWATGSIVGADQMNDIHNIIDNQVSGAIARFELNGVVSGWTLTPNVGNTVAAGEGWINGARCKTTGASIPTGLTGGGVTNYIFAQFKNPSSGRVSPSFALGEVAFVANTTGVVPANSILVATGVYDGVKYTSVDNSPVGRTDCVPISATQIQRKAVEMGDGSDGNLAGKLDARYQVTTTPVGPDTEFSVAHELGRTPVGFLVVNKNKGADVYDSGTAWDGTNINLKCTVASATITLLIW